MLDLDTLTLDKGSHDDRTSGMCLMEAVAYVAGEPHSDRPRCVSPVLTDFGQRLNDVLPDDKRQRLVPLIRQLVGTRGDGLDEQRGYLALDWLIRTYTPAWLDLAGLADEATALRDLRRIADLSAARAAGPVVRESADRGRAARAATEAAARDAAEAAAEDATEAAARVAAWDAAWAAARAAAEDATEDAWAAARVAAWDAAGDATWVAAEVAARDATWDAAWVATEAAARAAAEDATEDAWAAAWDALAPTVDQLQSSAIELYRTMIRPA